MPDDDRPDEQDRLEAAPVHGPDRAAGRSAGRPVADRRLVTAGGLVLGFGFGGLVDGIVLHQVLQWHNLISRVETNETLDGLQRNLFWDGVFHAAAATLTAVGLLVLWSARGAAGRLASPMRTLTGLALVGWGAFHVTDQLVFHLALDLHDIREDVAHPAVYNWSYFGIGLVLAAVGVALLRTRRPRDASTGASGPPPGPKSPSAGRPAV